MIYNLRVIPLSKKFWVHAWAEQEFKTTNIN